MRRTLLILLLLLLTAGLVWVLFYWAPAGETPTRGQGALNLAQAPRGGDFRLESWQGPVDTRDLRGKVLLIYFGYTFCPDICPTNLAILTQALNELTPDELASVQTLFVSVDPERDTLLRLKEYADYFHPNVLGVTGTADQVAAAAQRYGAAYRKAESDAVTGYLVDHSGYTYVLNQRGELVHSLNHATPAPEVLRLVRELLAKQQPTN